MVFVMFTQELSVVERKRVCFILFLQQKDLYIRKCSTMSVENVRIKKATFKMFSERFEAIACLTILFVFVRIILKANIKMNSNKMFGF